MHGECSSFCRVLITGGMAIGRIIGGLIRRDSFRNGTGHGTGGSDRRGVLIGSDLRPTNGN